MKLYYSPGACSMASHIVINELEKPVTLVKVDMATKKAEDGKDYLAINPNGYVPALQLADDSILTENIALLSFLAEEGNAGDIALPKDRLARAQLFSLLSFLTSELHKSYGIFFAQPPLADAAKAAALEKLDVRLAHMESLLSNGDDYLTGSKFSVADAYAFVMFNWSNFIGHSLASYPHITTFVKRVAARPSVQKALIAEGLA